MFCGECGAKNDSGALFCAECGKPLAHEENNAEVSKQPKEKKPMSKKNIIIIAVVAAIVLVLGIGYKVGSDLTSPEKVAKDYIQATIDMNGDKLYKYIGIEGDTTFASKKVFTEMIKSSDNKSDVVNFRIIDVKYGDGELSAVVTFKYTTKNSTYEKTDTVSLAKQSGKKYLLFDDWKVSDLSGDSLLVENFTVKVTKGAKLTFGGIEVADKYLDKEKSTTSLDVYVLPAVFKTSTTIKAVLTNGLEVEEKVTPSSYRDSCTIEFDEDSLSTATKGKLIDKTKRALTTVYTSAIAKKEFSEIKSNFEHNGLDLTKLETSYKKFVTNLSGRSRVLASIEFTDMSIYDVSLTTDGYIKVEVRASFNYSTKSTSSDGEETTDEDNDYKYMTVTYTYDNGEYYLVDMDKLQYYFY